MTDPTLPLRARLGGANETVDRSLHGAHESNGLVDGAAYHQQVDRSPSARWSLKAVADAGGTITRLRILTEKGPGYAFYDVSYIDASLPDGRIVAVDCPLSNLTPANKFMGSLIDWAKEQGVFAKGVGLLDKGNWSVL